MQYIAAKNFAEAFQTAGRLKSLRTSHDVRLVVLLSLLALVFSAIFWRLCCLTSGAYEARFASSVSSISALTTRRDIVDRNGQLLATNLMTGSIYANPKEILDAPEALKKLSKLFPELDKKVLKERLTSDRQFVWIKRNVTPQQQQEVHELGLPGIYFQKSEKRTYLQGAVTSHILGHVNMDMQGAAGVERYFDTHLTGQGEPLRLSIDMRIQNIMHEELKKGIETFKAIGGSAVMMDVETGEIIAMVSMPDFNPHDVGSADEEALFNRVTQGLYEMGSVFKVFTLAAALDSGKVTLNDGFDASKPFKVGRFTVRDHRGKNRWLSVPEIFMYSSNIGTIKMMQEIGKDPMLAFYKKIGFFEALSGFEYGEVAQPKVGGEWTEPRAITASYGYGVSITQLHLIRSMAAMVNGGTLVNPTLIKSNPERIEERVISKKTSEKIKKLLYLAVQKGTSRKAGVDGYVVGGKTGSANKIIDGKYNNKEHIATVMSVFPMTSPRYILLTSLDSPKGTKETFGFATGGWTAAPIAREVIKRAGPILKILPVDESSDVIKKAMYVKVEPDDKKRAFG